MLASAEVFLLYGSSRNGLLPAVACVYERVSDADVRKKGIIWSSILASSAGVIWGIGSILQ